MGGKAYYYVVETGGNLQATLDLLRKREFEAGRYNPVMWNPMATPDATPGPSHTSIAEAFEDSGPDGTASILDIQRIVSQKSYCAASPLSDEQLTSMFGTTEPEMAALHKPPHALFDDIERGMARYVLGFTGGEATHVLFIGCSFD